MATIKKRGTKTTVARKKTTTVVPSAKSSTIQSPEIKETPYKECCEKCGSCENCLHPAGNIRNYTPLLMLLLLISSFLLGMLLTKVGIMQDNNLSGYTTPSTTGTNNNQQPQAGTTPKPLHVAQAIGIDADKFKKCLDSDKYATQVATDFTAGQKAGVTGTPAVFVNGLSIVGAQPYSVFKQTIDQELANSRNTNENVLKALGLALIRPAYAQTQSVSGTQDTPTPPARVNVDVGPFPVLGDANAKVTIVEFADFQCPFCGQFYKDTEASIINDYVKTSKAKFAFQNYAFLGDESKVAAQGAYCANEQGKFWAYHNFLYTHQAQENSGQFTKANLE